MSRRRRGGDYQRLGRASRTCYDAYQSSWGKIIGGVLEGGLGTTIAAMSGEAGEEMLGIHGALGAIWLALTTKNYAEAGTDYLGKREEYIADLGIEILTYARLREQMPLEERPEDFFKNTNNKIIAAINLSLSSSSRLPEPVHAPETAAKLVTEIQNIASDRSKMSGAKMLSLIAATSALAAIGGAVAIPLTGKSTAAIATAGVGAALTSISGALLSSKATTSKNVSYNLYNAIKGLNEREFGRLTEDALDLTRQQIRQECARPAGSMRAISVAPAVPTVSVGFSCIKKEN